MRDSIRFKFAVAAELPWDHVLNKAWEPKERAPHGTAAHRHAAKAFATLCSVEFHSLASAQQVIAAASNIAFVEVHCAFVE